MRRLHACLAIVCLAWGASPGKSPTKLLAVMHEGRQYLESLDGLRSELGAGYFVHALVVDKALNIDSLAHIYEEKSCAGFVLMDTEAIRLVKELEKRGETYRKAPKFVLMTLQAQKASSGLHNATGIRFEVPAFSLMLNLRRLSGQNISRIGVFYRKKFAPMVEESRRFLSKEKMELIGYCVDCGDRKIEDRLDLVFELKKGLRELDRRYKVDVYWMLADNFLVNDHTLSSFWIKRVGKTRKPLVVPLENLAQPDLNLGLFAANPNYYQMGVQAAGLVFQVFEEDESASNIGFEPLISIRTVLNLERARDIEWDIRSEHLKFVDKVLR